ncbi:MAG TPA: sialidase family protein [Candidatus Saccharimonadales bacterium]|jgi:hypothetical protein|nr:sialidase family protein [Candidatus Saccharimonadales bacterium]
MRTCFKAVIFLFCFATPLLAQNSTNNLKPSWWSKFLYLSGNAADPAPGTTTSIIAGTNVDVSNECGPQSETFIATNSAHPQNLAGGANEIFRNPMRGYSSGDGGSSWTGVDLPLPASNGANSSDFGSDPTLAFDSQGNLFYGYIVVFFGNGKQNGVNGTEMAVARSTDGGRSYPGVSFFSFATGSDHFNDKPMITADANPGSPFRDSVYIAWDAASGGSSNGGIRFGRSADSAQTFTVTRIDDPNGPGQSIGAVPFVGPKGEVYVAWNDLASDTITFNRSFDGGVTFGSPSVVATKNLTLQSNIPAELFRGALVYPACDADRSNGPHRGRLYCSWMDSNSTGNTDIFMAFSDNQGATWSAPVTVADPLHNVDRFNQWMAVDPVTGDVNFSFYDTRNDTTGSRFQTDIFFTQSVNGGASFSSPNTRVTTVSSNEHDCNGVFPCAGVNLGDQQGDYEGLTSFGGVSHPIWTDSRLNLTASSGCRTNLLMEEVFTATVGRTK